MKSDCVSHEINSTILKVVLLKNILHWSTLKINTIPGHWVFWIDILDVLVESDNSLLFKHTHQVGFECLHVIGWHLAYCHLGS